MTVESANGYNLQSSTRVEVLTDLSSLSGSAAEPSSSECSRYPRKCSLNELYAARESAIVFTHEDFSRF